MSTEQDQLRQIAERVARRVTPGNKASDAGSGQASTDSAVNLGSELAAVRASLEELQQKLAQIESHVMPQSDSASFADERSQRSETQRVAKPHQASAVASPGATRSPWLSGMYVPAAAHPSQEKFEVEEATVAELVDFFEGEKKCELEPGGKPCDHCAMCSSRGF